MKNEPKKAYVYQPMPPQKDGRFYGVGGLHFFGIDFDKSSIKGVTKQDAQFIVNTVNSDPDGAEDFIKSVIDSLHRSYP